MRKRLMACGVLALLALTALLLAGIAKPQQDAAYGGAGLVLLDTENGPYVLAVTADSAADDAGVQPGDYLVQVDGKPAESAQQAFLLLQSAAQHAMLTLRRQGVAITVLLMGR